MMLVVVAMPWVLVYTVNSAKHRHIKLLAHCTKEQEPMRTRSRFRGRCGGCCPVWIC